MTCASCGFDADAWSRELAALPWDSELPRDSESVHRGWQLLSVAGRIRHRTAPTQQGVVAQISTSSGGVPKLTVSRADVTFRGLAGDKQSNRIHHGRPWQAVCLWSAEVIDELAAAGHPIGYGSAGENLTLRGLDWSQVRPGLRLLVGTAVLETTPYAIPCTKNARWFSDGRFRRMAHEVTPGTSRIYARVVVEGTIAAGDAAVVEPAGPAGELTAAQSICACATVTAAASVPAQRPANPQPSQKPGSPQPTPTSA